MDTIIDFIHSIDNNIASFVRYIVYDSDPVTGLALMFAIPTALAAGLALICKLLEYLNDRFGYLNERFEYFNLIHKIKTNPKDADTLIQIVITISALDS